jgi:hypothetical protein
MSLMPLVTLAAAESSGGVNPWFVGISVFLLLLVMLGGLLAFGGGRDHS